MSKRKTCLLKEDELPTDEEDTQSDLTQSVDESLDEEWDDIVDEALDLLQQEFALLSKRIEYGSKSISTTGSPQQLLTELLDNLQDLIASIRSLTDHQMVHGLSEAFQFIKLSTRRLISQLHLSP